MFECEDNWLSEKHSAGLFVDGGSNYMGVDCQALLLKIRPLHFHFHCSILSGQEGSQIFIQNEHHLYLSYKENSNTKRLGENYSKSKNKKQRVRVLKGRCYNNNII